MGIFSNNPDFFKRGGKHYSGGSSTGGGSLSVEGFEEAQIFLKTLPEKVNRRVLISAIKKAARPAIAEMKRQAPVADRKVVEWWGDKRVINPGLLKKSIGSVAARSRGHKFVSVYIGPKRPKSALKGRVKKGAVNQNDVWYRHFVIRGTAGYTVKKGKNAGRYFPGQKANPFVDRVMDSMGGNVGNQIEKNITDTVRAYCKRNKIEFRA